MCWGTECKRDASHFIDPYMDELTESTEFRGECHFRFEASPAKVYKIPQNAGRRSTFFGSIGHRIVATYSRRYILIVLIRYIFEQGAQYRYSGLGDITIRPRSLIRFGHESRCFAPTRRIGA